jgi:lysophospholipase L1-like esterase
MRESLDGRPVIVTYDAPLATGGVPPVAVTCMPISGAEFPVGASNVACLAQDAASGRAECSFRVNVTQPRLVATRFLSFGDSLTAGTTSMAPMILLVNNSDSYPFKLHRSLTSRYQSQVPQVLNDGVGGEYASKPGFAGPSGRARLPGSLDANRPEVLLLMEGTNDLLDLQPGADAALVALEEMIRLTRGRGIRVMIATIPPQRSGGLRHRDAVAAIIPSFNESIRQMAARERVPVVDVYNALKDRMDLIGIDDLHPTPEGYDVIAATFFEAIRANLEEPRTTIVR